MVQDAVCFVDHQMQKKSGPCREADDLFVTGIRSQAPDPVEARMRLFTWPRCRGRTVGILIHLKKDAHCRAGPSRYRPEATGAFLDRCQILKRIFEMKDEDFSHLFSDRVPVRSHKVSYINYEALVRGDVFLEGGELAFLSSSGIFICRVILTYGICIGHALIDKKG